MAGTPAVPHTRAMGLIRKSLSVSTLGLVDFRSDKERTARYTRHTRNAIRAQSKMQGEIAAQQSHAAYQTAAATQQSAHIAAGQLGLQQGRLEQQPPIPAGWYRDPAGAPCMRWWDGRQWTPGTQPLQ